MRSSACILAFALCLKASSAVAALAFGEARPIGGTDLAMPLFAAQTPLPLEMPRAASYIVSHGEGKSIVDRYDLADLWTARAVKGRWIDPEGRVLTLARLDTHVPYGSDADAMTRADYYAMAKELLPNDLPGRDAAVRALAPAPAAKLLDPVRPRRSRRRNFREIVEYPAETADATPAPALVWAFRMKNPGKDAYQGWYLATLELLPDDLLDSVRAVWEEDFLDRVQPGAAIGMQDRPTAEKELLFRDRAASVAAYPEWRATQADEFSILDNLQDRGAFAGALTNEIAVMRRAYAASAPSPVALVNSVALMRVFKTKREYLDYVGDDFEWTAGVWDAEHRELAAWLPGGGEEDLMKTLRHEAFHQYLAAAAELVTASPWFNEGHAEMFECAAVKDGEARIQPSIANMRLVRPRAKELAALLPSVLAMDYKEFYAGGLEEVELKYALAWSIAYFLEKGAPLIRNRPFDGLREKYMQELVSSRSRAAATAAVFTDDVLERFTAAWIDFYEIK